MKIAIRFWMPAILFALSSVFLTNCKEDATFPAISTTQVSKVTQTTATGGGIVHNDGKAIVTARGVCWSTSRIPTIADNKTTDGTGVGSFTSAITDLTANTRYYVRAYATNSVGTGYGIEISFTTKQNPVIPVLSTTVVTDILSTTAKSGGNITFDGGDRVTKRGVCWSTSETPTIADNKTTDGSGIGSFISKITGLTGGGTTYYIRAYATNSVGTGYGNVMSFTTLHSFTDSRDGNVYKTVKIGNQVWMTENLRYLPIVVGPEKGSIITPYFYVYGYKYTDGNIAKGTSEYATYGVLYNWAAACSSCPAGWHLPSDEEWTQLTDYLGGKPIAGGKLKEIGTTHWESPNYGATNESGFTALPGGERLTQGVFSYIGKCGYWWSASEYDYINAWYRKVDCDSSNVFRYRGDEESGFSVRCVKD